MNSIEGFIIIFLLVVLVHSMDEVHEALYVPIVNTLERKIDDIRMGIELIGLDLRPQHHFI